MNRSYRVGANELTLLRNGTDFFPQLCADIDAAKHSVYLETYIYADDATGHRVGKALQRAAIRGVEVRLLLDGFGSAELPGAFIDELRKVGVRVQWFRREVSPYRPRRKWARHLRRLHRKLAVMDGTVAFVGGINIVNDIPVELDHAAPRLDYTVRVTGELAGEVLAATQRLWEMVSWAAFRRRIRAAGWRLHRRKRPHDGAGGQLLLRDNVRHRRDILRAYVRAITSAKHEVLIANAYFLPGRLLRRALVHAARRGVRVVLLLQGKVEYRLQHYATLALYGRLLGAGVEIYEYHASYMHAKAAVVDGEWATVGSFNFDPFSLWLAREANLVVRDKGFAGALRDSLWNAIEEDGRRVTLARAGLFKRVLARVSYGLVRFIVGVLGLSRTH